MKQRVLFPFGGTQALPIAAAALQKHGCTLVDRPCDEVTHLLLPVPSFESDGTVRGSGELEEVLKLLPRNVTVVGGRLDHPLLADYLKIDLLVDAQYLAENARLTAQCALGLVLNLLPVHLCGLPVLVVGWGRIGKCLAQSLQLLGAKICVAARKESDRAMLCALDYEALSMQELPVALSQMRVIFNTVPAPVLSHAMMQSCRPDCIKIDLASTCGMEGSDVLCARGLPGKHLPESSGLLVAKTVLRQWEKEDFA